MNTSSFLSTLRAHSGLPLVFQAGSAFVPPGYHLTEVKEVAYRTMDCGAMTHCWTENHFEVWVPPSTSSVPADLERGYMTAAKFLRIVDRVQQEIPLDGQAEAKVYASIAGQPAAVHTVGAVARDGDRLVVSLRADQARCKARERSQAEGCGCGAKQRTEVTPAAAVCCA